jgi:putative hydrolase of HD superfamily
MNRLDALLALLALDRLPRTGWLQHGVPAPESIGGHVLGTAHVAVSLAARVHPPVDLGRLLALILVHDAPEALTGDLPRAAAELLPPGAKHSMEEGAAARLLGPLAPRLVEAWAEYSSGASREARLARHCDTLQLGVRLLGYRKLGHLGLDEFLRGVERLDCAEFPPAEELRREILAAWKQAGG